jgi:2-polyprenyl-3-methyl-5-hydroxy-6-metoxy-1,4-benzoquinol methylase
MYRKLEPELMDDIEQANAYHAADFSGAHNRRVDVFKELAPPEAQRGMFLDLGCGSGDLTVRFLSALGGVSILGIDGSQAMIDIARAVVAQRPTLQGRASFLVECIPTDNIPRSKYTTIMTNGFLHHLHDPQNLWETLQGLGTPETFIFVADLRRPSTEEAARRIVEERAADEPDILKRDFFNSLCAAFEPSEIQEQLDSAGISGLKVTLLDEIHLVVHGFMR